jgi:hypothetical protein
MKERRKFMADEPKKPWTPDQPLEDEELEKEANDRARLRARVKFLEEKASTPPKKDKKKFLDL